eukprot:3355993-Pleurochrysis_carterae.AAC.1
MQTPCAASASATASPRRREWLRATTVGAVGPQCASTRSVSSGCDSSRRAHWRKMRRELGTPDSVPSSLSSDTPARNSGWQLQQRFCQQHARETGN